MNLRALLPALLVIGLIAIIWSWRASSDQSRLEGRITDVRTLEVEENASVLLVNFEVANVTKLPFVAHERWLEVIDANGNQHKGLTIQGADMHDLFRYFAAELGGMKDAPFVAQTVIEAGETHRALLGARLEISKAELEARREIIVRIFDGVRRETQLRLPAQD